MAKHWASNVTILPAPAESVTTSPPYLPLHPSDVVPQVWASHSTDWAALDWLDQWRRMSLYERGTFILAVVTTLLTMAQVAIGAAELLQRPQTPTTTERVGSTNHGPVEAPTTTPPSRTTPPV
jgi:hypothetical protein